MYKNFIKTGVAASAIAMSAGVALAGGSATFTPVKSTGLIEVVSQDGKTWSEIKGGGFTASLIVTMKATGDDHVLSWVIQQEGATVKASGDFGTKKDKEYSSVETFIATTKNIKLTRQAIINTCNAKLNVGKGIHQDHMVQGVANFTLIAGFFHPAVLFKNRYGFEKEAPAGLAVGVKCVGVPQALGPVAKETLTNKPKPTHSPPNTRR